MRISVITGPFQSLLPGPAGATEKAWQGLAEQFAAQGHRVSIICRSWDGQEPRDVRKGVEYVRLPGWRRTGFLAWDVVKDLGYSLNALKSIAPSDIAVTNAFWLPALLTLFSRHVGKVVVSVERFPKGQLRLYGRAARLRATSTVIGDAIRREWRGAAGRVKVIPNPVDTVVFRSPAEARRSSGARTILYTGRIHPEKGIHLLIQAFARVLPAFPDLRLRLLGPAGTEQGGGGERYMRTLRLLAGSLPVRFDEPVSNPQELCAALEAAHYYCYPSVAERGESFGVAPLEAMATGLAPIVSGLACFRDFIEHGATGLVFDHRGPGAVDNLAEAIRLLIADGSMNERLGAAAALKATQFSYDAVAKQFLADFEELLH